MDKFPTQVDTTDESILHAALRGTREVGMDEVEILGKLGPPALSLSGLVLCCEFRFRVLGSRIPLNNLGEGVSRRKKTIRISPRHRRCVTTIFASLVILDTSNSRLPLFFTSLKRLSEDTSSADPLRIGHATLQISAPGIKWSNSDSENEVVHAVGRMFQTMFPVPSYKPDRR